ncbi:hypothetical protein glysoja_024917 [Glycine soja]|uniref:Uncharacterized protein n=1 Tax=Glycine soja TaxID=3848 RepID=A0A0B2QRB8_GLYSO|nr:hypothetical protein glysoja_024917 [Glycine soja]
MDKLYHVLMCFSLTFLFYALASLTPYPYRRYAISIGSVLSLLAGAAKEAADHLGYFRPLPELPSGTPLPTSLASASLPSLFLFSDPLLRLLTSALSPLFDLTDQFSRIHSLIHHRCFNYSITLSSNFLEFVQ